MRKSILKVMAVVFAAMALVSCAKEKEAPMRLLYWNIQNGMWDGQNDNYDRINYN